MHKGMVVHLTSAHPPFDTRIFHKECCSLAAAAYDVKIIVPHDMPETVNGVQILPIPMPSDRFHRMTKTASLVYRAASQLDADIYHFHDPELIPVGLLLKQEGHRVVYDAHEDAPQSLLSGGRDYLAGQIKQPVSWLLDQLEKFAARRFTAIVSATPAIARRFSRLNSNSVTINNFPKTDELVSKVNLLWHDRQHSVAYIGGISWERGLREMIEAIALVNAKAETTLKLAGRFENAQMRIESSLVPGWQNVEDFGYLDRPAVANLLSTVRGGLVVLHPEPRFMVSQPIKLYEYMSASIPVIASDFPMWRELIERERCGLLVDPLDSASIADAIHYVLTHPDEAEAMGRNGREAIVRSYNWGIEEQKLLALYSQLLSTK